jgi:hypothetical protein
MKLERLEAKADTGILDRKCAIQDDGGGRAGCEGKCRLLIGPRWRTGDNGGFIPPKQKLGWGTLRGEFCFT